MTADNPYNCGDVVRLRSGGPAMTVDALLGNGAVTCSWFHDGRRLSTNIPTTSLLSLREAGSEREGVH